VIRMRVSRTSTTISNAEWRAVTPKRYASTTAGGVAAGNVDASLRESRRLGGVHTSASIVECLNRLGDALVRPYVRVFAWTVPAFRLTGYVGFVLAVAVVLALGTRAGLDPQVLTTVAAGGVVSFFALACATKLFGGSERLTFYHHALALGGVATAVAWAGDESVLRVMDVTVLGLGVFLACGRIGCLLTGCCHGRPARIGVRYRREHVRSGFPRGLTGVTLIPVQAVEALGAIVIVATGAAFVLAGARAGEALAWFVVGYAALRFTLEFARGDAGRWAALGFSEAQWTSAALLSGVVVAERLEWLPPHRWHALVTLAVLAAMAVAWVARRGRSPLIQQLRRPLEMLELADTLDLLLEQAAYVAPRSSSAGFHTVAVAEMAYGARLSASPILDHGPPLMHYAISGTDRPLSEAEAVALARTIRVLRHPGCSLELHRGTEDVYHFLVRPHASSRAQRRVKSKRAAKPS
jgi:hypothetical protein